MSKSESKAASGFTLIELMITVTVLVVLIGIGFPSFSAMLRSSRIAASSNDFIASVSLARSEAIKNNIAAVICASDTGTACGANWNNGWMVFSDVNNNGTYEAGIDNLLRFSAGSPTTISMTTAAGGTMAFNSRGVYTGVAPPATFTMKPIDCPIGYPGKRTFNLLITGQLSMTKVACP